MECSFFCYGGQHAPPPRRPSSSALTFKIRPDIVPITPHRTAGLFACPPPFSPRCHVLLPPVHWGAAPVAFSQCPDWASRCLPNGLPTCAIGDMRTHMRRVSLRAGAATLNTRRKEGAQEGDGGPAQVPETRCHHHTPGSTPPLLRDPGASTQMPNVPGASSVR